MPERLKRAMGQLYTQVSTLTLGYGVAFRHVEVGANQPLAVEFARKAQ